ncbi:helix-turn-helix transcriptional regulator [uncultured Bilophila sp.]|uniref:helix-turn-helix domain-containing protein n=1 Tax=uncultured Bilophila sp. TaxID=529385 RepID=UPI00280B53AC|nr:helix-turn-helix transcriptional regulator [uncultured Bilophila sp.]
MTTFRQAFGSTFRKIRKSKNLKQEEVAERSGLSTSYISDVERGVANPKLYTIRALAKGVGVTEKELFAFEKRDLSPDDIRDYIIESLNDESDEAITSLYNKIVNMCSMIKS